MKSGTHSTNIPIHKGDADQLMTVLKFSERLISEGKLILDSHHVNDLLQAVLKSRKVATGNVMSSIELGLQVTPAILIVVNVSSMLSQITGEVFTIIQSQLDYRKHIMVTDVDIQQFLIKKEFGRNVSQYYPKIQNLTRQLQARLAKVDTLLNEIEIHELTVIIIESLTSLRGSYPVNTKITYEDHSERDFEISISVSGPLKNKASVVMVNVKVDEETSVVAMANNFTDESGFLAAIKKVARLLTNIQFTNRAKTKQG